MEEKNGFKDTQPELSLVQSLLLRRLELAAEAVRDLIGGRIWISIGIPTGETTEEGAGFLLQTYSVACQCKVCEPINQQIVDEIQALIEKYADIRSNPRTTEPLKLTGEDHGS